MPRRWSGRSRSDGAVRLLRAIDLALLNRPCCAFEAASDIRHRHSPPIRPRTLACIAAAGANAARPGPRRRRTAPQSVCVRKSHFPKSSAAGANEPLCRRLPRKRLHRHRARPHRQDHDLSSGAQSVAHRRAPFPEIAANRPALASSLRPDPSAPTRSARIAHLLPLLLPQTVAKLRTHRQSGQHIRAIAASLFPRSVERVT